MEIITMKDLPFVALLGVCCWFWLLKYFFCGRHPLFLVERNVITHHLLFVELLCDPLY